MRRRQPTSEVSPHQGASSNTRKDHGMEAHELNLPAQIKSRVATGKVTLGWPLFMVAARTILFVVIALIVVAFMAATGSADPWAAYIPWWPYQVIVANILIYLLLVYLARREGLSMKSLLGFRPGFWKKDLLHAAALLIPGVVVCMIGLFGTSFLILGTMPPESMVQSLPLVAAVGAAVLFPLTNALVETTTYMGYALPRLEVLTRSQALALLLSAVGLSAQHVAIPIILDGPFLLWRLVSLLPLALFVGLVYIRMRRLMPLVLVHFLMDLQLGVTLVIHATAAARR
eukprot:GEZU01011696.1.p1 GENE.GEZU01011696.1~~GEZU01011696.1.p1  ORF type:complete len:287 (-),score=7.93 GEZU01011696.1:108-968(-)